MHDLSSRVNARIGSSGRKSLDRPVRVELADRRLELGLHTVAVVLPLPATKSRTLVLQAEGNPLNGRSLRSCGRGFGGQTSELTWVESVQLGFKPVR